VSDAYATPWNQGIGHMRSPRWARWSDDRAGKPGGTGQNKRRVRQDSDRPDQRWR